MQVPTLKGSLVQAQPVGTPYAQADVSALSQGGGVAEGVSSIGGELADYAIKSRKQALQASYNNATANGQAQQDATWASLSSKTGAEYMQAIEPTMATYEQLLAETRANLDPDVQPDFDAWATRSKGELRARAVVRGDDIATDMVQGALANKIQTLTASGAGDARNIRFSQYAADANKEAGTGTKAPEISGNGFVDVRLGEIDEAIDAYEGPLTIVIDGRRVPVDRETFTRLSKERAHSDFHLGIITGMLTPTPGQPVDDRAALAYFKEHESDMEQDDRTQVQGHLDRAVQTGEIQRDTASIWGKQDVAAPWSERRKEFSEAASKAEYPAETQKALDAMADGQMKREHDTRNETHNALKQALATGTPLADVVQSTAFGSLSEEPDLQDSLVTYGGDVIAGKYAVTDWAEYGRLQMLRDEDPQAFVNENLDANNGLNEADRKYMKAGQKELGGLSSGGLTYDAVVSGAARALYPDSFTSSDEKLAGLRGQFAKDVNDAVIAFQIATKKQATPEDVEKITDAYLGKQVFRVPYRVFGLFETGSMTTEEKAVSDMLPASVLDDAITALTKAKLPITTENLAEFARRWHAGG